MSGIEIRQRTASEGQSGGRRGQERGGPPLYIGLAGALVLFNLLIITASFCDFLHIVYFKPVLQNGGQNFKGR